MEVVLDRKEYTKDGVFGALSVDGKQVCLTLEEQWLDNKPRISCIPAGKYTARKYSGTKYKDVWILENVPGRSAILIHYGNTNDNTAGCILVGKGTAMFGKKKGITNSRVTLDMLRKILPDKFTLDIRGPF